MTNGPSSDIQIVANSSIQEFTVQDLLLQPIGFCYTLSDNESFEKVLALQKSILDKQGKECGGSAKGNSECDKRLEVTTPQKRLISAVGASNRDQQNVSGPSGENETSVNVSSLGKEDGASRAKTDVPTGSEMPQVELPKAEEPAAKVNTEMSKAKKLKPQGAEEIRSEIAPEAALEGLQWMRKEFRRLRVSSKVRSDKYWYSPITHRKFRSMNEVKRFLTHLKTTNGDEDAAYKLFKEKRLSRHLCATL
jgi:hypothetical protein